MTSTAACVLATIVLALFGTAGLVAGMVWRKRAYVLPRPLFVLGLMLVLLGVWLVLNQKNRLAEWGAVMQWSSVQGVVVGSRVAGDRAVHPEIIYEYAVGGNLYRDTTGFDTPSFGGRNAKRDVAETIAAQFPAGSAVTVHYDPVQPSRSLLRLSPGWAMFGKAGMGGTLFGIGVFLLVGVRVRRS